MKKLAFLLVVLAGCCGTRETQIVERTVTAPPIHIRDTVYLKVPQFILNPSCDTAAILEKYCNPIVEHTDSVGNFWRAQYNWISGRFTEFVNTHPQQVKYIDTTLNVTYQKVDPGFWWLLWHDFKVVVATLGVLALVAGILYGLSKVNIIKLPSIKL